MPGDSKRAALFDPDRVLESFKIKVSQEGVMAYLEYLVTQRKSEVSFGLRPSIFKFTPVEACEETNDVVIALEIGA